ncbi:MAG: hypothetical protein KDA57_06720 [Planctomycetales bacterium]|nr:hypothetical protein [Planctomycetales bacterium]
MKTERRHDLETNELAVRLTHWIEKLKPHTGTIVGIVIVLLGIAAVGSFWNSQSDAKLQAAWDEFAIAYDSTDVELASLRRVADKDEYSDTPMREWAYITWADRQVALAAGEYLINRDAALERLRQVEGVFKELSTGVSDEVIKNRARFGLARAYELQNKLEEARKQYALVQGDLQQRASQRAEQLESAKVQEACAWLATAELPKPSANATGGEPGARPDFEAALPEVSAEGGSSIMQSLEEILGAAGGEPGDESRYPTEKPDEQAEAADEADAADVESESDVSTESTGEEPTAEATEDATEEAAEAAPSEQAPPASEEEPATEAEVPAEVPAE